MNLYEKFIQANKHEQGNILFANGEFLASKSLCGFKLNLFRLDHHLFEVWYNPSSKAIEKIVHLKDFEMVYSYFKHVNINQVGDYLR